MVTRSKSKTQKPKQKPKLKRKMKKKRVKKVERQYTQESLEQAVQDVKNGKLSIRDAADKYDVPRSTIHSKVHGRSAIDCKKGPPTILTGDEEDDLVKWVLIRAERGFPVTRRKLLTCVQNFVISQKRENPFRNNRPGSHWYKGFMRRHQTLSMRVSQKLTTSRASVSREQVYHYHDSLVVLHERKELKDVPPGSQFNLDETCFEYIPDESVVLAGKGASYVYRVVHKEKCFLTVLFTVSADGKIAPPMVLFDLKNPPKKELLEKLPGDFVIGNTEHGWMTIESYLKYMKFFNKWLRDNGASFPVVVYADRHSSHFSLEVLTYCKQNQIELVSLLPNATHIMQPLDISFFKPLKQYYKAVYDEVTESDVFDVDKAACIRILKKTLELHKDALSQCIINGFKKAGLYPLNKEAINCDILEESNRNNLPALQPVSGDETHSTATEDGQLIQQFEKCLPLDTVELFRQSVTKDVWDGDESKKELFIVWKKMHGMNEVTGQSSGDFSIVRQVEDVPVIISDEPEPILNELGEVIPVVKLHSSSCYASGSATYHNLAFSLDTSEDGNHCTILPEIDTELSQSDLEPYIQDEFMPQNNESEAELETYSAILNSSHDMDLNITMVPLASAQFSIASDSKNDENVSSTESQKTCVAGDSENDKGLDVLANADSKKRSAVTPPCPHKKFAADTKPTNSTDISQNDKMPSHDIKSTSPNICLTGEYSPHTSTPKSSHVIDTKFSDDKEINPSKVLKQTNSDNMPQSSPVTSRSDASDSKCSNSKAVNDMDYGLKSSLRDFVKIPTSVKKKKKCNVEVAFGDELLENLLKKEKEKELKEQRNLLNKQEKERKRKEREMKASLTKIHQEKIRKLNEERKDLAEKIKSLKSSLKNESDKENDDVTTENLTAVEANTPRFQLTAEQDQALRKMPGYNTCITETCNLTAEWILQAMDQSVDPCHDFYKFACGSFEAKLLSSDDPGVEAIMEEQVKEDIVNITPADDRRTFRLVSEYYTACMGDDRLREKKMLHEGGEEFLPLTILFNWTDDDRQWTDDDRQKWSEVSNMEKLKGILAEFGGWPVLDGDKWREDEFNWEETAYRSRRMGYDHNSFFHIFVGPDRMNSTRNIIYLNPVNWLGQPLDALSGGLGSDKMTKVVKFMVDIAVKLGLNRTQAEGIMPESTEFGINLGRMLLSAWELQNKTVPYKLTTVRELMMEYPSIPWLKYIGTILAPVVNITEMEPVYVANSPYFTELVKLLNQTSKRSLANYMMWRIIDKSIGTFLYEVREMRQDAYGLPKLERYEECFQSMKYDLPLGLAKVYIRNHRNEDTIRHAKEMALRIRERFRLIVQNANWTVEYSKNAVLKLLDGITMTVGYPDELADDSRVDTFYEKLNLSTTDSFLDIRRKCHSFNLENFYAQLRKSANETDWTDFTKFFNVNAYYVFRRKQLEIPMARLQDPFFNHERPYYVNYGVTGSLIGHEIAHGLYHTWYEHESDKLEEFQGNGTEQSYLDKRQCFIDQANNYTLRGTTSKINGSSTAAENICDNYGLKMAYLTYQDWESNRVTESRLPGLQNYTSQQMLWISYARSRCANDISDGTSGDTHSPGQFRVNGPISNIPEFASDFECPANSNMNPLNKCHIW